MSGDGGGRLPSFKGPRDLSLLTSAALTLSLSTPGQPSSSTSSRMQPSSLNQPPVVVRPKRVFKPNIPPKRDTSIASSSSSKDPPTSSSSQKSSSPADKSSKSGRGHDRGGRGGRGGRGRGANLIQSSSVFEEGVGDPTSSGRSTRSRRGGGGDGGSRGAGRSRGRGRGMTRVASAMTREKLEDIIKTENTKVEAHDNIGDFMSGGIEEEDDLETFEDEDEAVVLPLTSYLPKLIISKKTPKFLPGGQKGKQHIFYKSDNRGQDFLSVTAKSRKKPVLCLFQLPSHLPVLLEQEKRQLATSLETLPEGLIGKMQFLADGRCRFILENSQGGEKNMFDVEAGKATGFRQDLTSINTESGKLVELGPVEHKFVITPDIETLLLNMR